MQSQRRCAIVEAPALGDRRDDDWLMVGARFALGEAASGRAVTDHSGWSGAGTSDWRLRRSQRQAETTSGNGSASPVETEIRGDGVEVSELEGL
jgi:hypothetical protein